MRRCRRGRGARPARARGRTAAASRRRRPARSGASRSQNASRATVAAISAPMPNGTTASWAMRSRPVLCTDSRIGAMSSGATVRRSITSTEMPSPATRSAAATASWTIRETDTTVTSVPGRTTADRADRDDVVGRRLRSLHAVEQPVLDEDHRVRVLDRGTQQAVGVGRRRRHDDGQPGDVREQRLEALRVLAARRAPGAELGPHGQRHLGGAAGHERQLRRLVEQLVEADAEEVEVHHLDDRAHAGHRRADAEPDDRRLRDRRVAHPVAELLGAAPA